VEQDQRVEVNPVCGRPISRNINNLYIFKNMSFAIKYMVTFLPMFKDNKATDLFYKILVTLKQQIFLEVASTVRNVNLICV